MAAVTWRDASSPKKLLTLMAGSVAARVPIVGIGYSHERRGPIGALRCGATVAPRLRRRSGACRLSRALGPGSAVPAAGARRSVDVARQRALAGGRRHEAARMGADEVAAPGLDERLAHLVVMRRIPVEEQGLLQPFVA